MVSTYCFLFCINNINEDEIMARPKDLQGTKDRQDNEFYTLYSSVEYVFNNVDGLKEYVKDTKINILF